MKDERDEDDLEDGFHARNLVQARAVVVLLADSNGLRPMSRDPKMPDVTTVPTAATLRILRAIESADLAALQTRRKKLVKTHIEIRIKRKIATSGERTRFAR